MALLLLFRTMALSFSRYVVILNCTFSSSTSCNREREQSAIVLTNILKKQLFCCFVLYQKNRIVHVEASWLLRSCTCCGCRRCWCWAAPCRIRMCDVTNIWMRHIWTWIIHTCDKSRWHVWHDSLTCIRCPIYRTQVLGVFTLRAAMLLIQMYDMTHSYMWHGSFLCMTWLTHMCDMTHLYVWHDFFTCVPGLIHLPRMSGVLTLRSIALTLGLAYPLNMPPNNAIGTNDRKSKGRFSINCRVCLVVYVRVWRWD